MESASFRPHWTDIAPSLLKIGATAYGGPAIKLMVVGAVLGVLQSRWLSPLPEF